MTKKKKTDSAKKKKATVEVPLDKALGEFRLKFEAIAEEMSVRIVGMESIVRDVLIALFAGGHVLLEGVPGLGKTMLVRTLAQAVDLSFARIQCTPDLMPADILGTHLVMDDESGNKRFRFRKGPIFTNLLLADEINRATPKTQSGLLEAMQEKAVTSGGRRRVVPSPFFVLATQNPIEMEGTYPLPEAQVDRFLFKLNVPFPDPEALCEIANRTTGPEESPVQPVICGEEILQFQELLRHVPVADDVQRFAARLIAGTHPDRPESPDIVRQFVRYGASPRGMQGLILGGKIRAVLDGRSFVSSNDIRQSAPAVLRHRILRNFEGEAEGVSPEAIVEAVLDCAQAPLPAGVGPGEGGVEGAL